MLTEQYLIFCSKTLIAMPHIYSSAEYADMIFIYGYCNGNGARAATEYRRRFHGRRIPNEQMFSRLFRKLRDTGRVPSVHFTTDRPTRQSLEEVEDILDVIQDIPSTSTRRISNNLRVPHVRIWKTLREHGLYPYHIQQVQDVQLGDHGSRLEFCNWINGNNALHKFILFTDESQFTRNGVHNARNAHRWTDENPHAYVKCYFQHRFHVNVWCGILHNQLIGPFIIDGNQTAQAYLHFLQNELPQLLEDIPLLIRRQMYYQHDGAPAHFSREVRWHLDDAFPGRWIGRGGPITWPARSPDLTPMDYGIWGWMKALVYEREVNTREELIARIHGAAARVRQERYKLGNITKAIYTRATKCIENGGGVFENSLQ